MTKDDIIINLYFSLKEDGVPVELIAKIIKELVGEDEN